jgi:hypothetical protein
MARKIGIRSGLAPLVGNVRYMETGAEYLRVKPKAGHYESFYVKAAAPGGGKAFWIRYTVHKRPGAEPTASLWFTFFDRDSGGPQAAKVTVGSDQLAAPPGADAAWLEIDGAELGPGWLRGSIDLPELKASWDLQFDLYGAPCQYLPKRWMYRAPLPRTKLLAPAPYTHFRGNIELQGETFVIDAWPGMVGHNWGAEHAERWVWLQGNGFAEAEAQPGDYFDCAAARVKVAGRTLPWMAVGMLRLDGREYRLGGPRRVRSTEVDARPGSCDFVLPGDGVTVHGRLSAPLEHFVGWIYADPDGPEHHTINCSVSDLELTVERPGQPARQLALAAAGAYELGMRETDHGVPIQPYADG